MRKFIDDLGFECVVSYPPQRMISLCPSITETLFDLGLEKRIVGITKFCIHPTQFVKNIAKVGGTKKINYEIINELKPDLIICQKEENTQEIVESLQKLYPVFVTDVNTFDEGLRMIRHLGELTDEVKKAKEIIQEIENQMFHVNLIDKTFLYFIWKNPWMIAGKNTFIDSVCEKFGLKNVISDADSRYPTLTYFTDFKYVNPDYIFLSSEPYPFENKHISEIQDFFPQSKVMLVDGEIFSWYGSRMKNIKSYMETILK